MKKLLNIVGNRLFQRSTANGASILTYALGIYFGPGTIDAVLLAVASVHGAVEAIRDERRK